MIAELKGGLQTDIREIELENYKPIKRYEVIGVEEAINLSKELMEVEEWIYLKVETDRYLSGSSDNIINNRNGSWKLDYFWGCSYYDFLWTKNNESKYIFTSNSFTFFNSSNSNRMIHT